MNSVLPFLKWPGGKRWAAASISEIIYRNLTGTYFEPFLGGGAVFFHLSPPSAVLSDINPDLVNAYLQVKSNGARIVDAIRRMPVTEEFYYALRLTDPGCPETRAVRFLYLNRTAFGGIYRLNSQGQFNVPYGGRRPDPLWKANLVERAASALQSAEIVVNDFEATMVRAGKGDVVYCDPTYTVARDSGGFRRYNERNFAWSDQLRLAESTRAALDRGATVLISNAHDAGILELYCELGAVVVELTRASRVSARTSGRRRVTEYLFVLTPN